MSEGESRKIIFVICPIGESGSPDRWRSDQILSYIISPVAKDLGYEVVRADKISEPGMITTQIIRQLLEVPLVIADLSGHNPNVFYELAIRHAIRKPVILMIEKGQKIPFDIAGLRTIELVTESFDLGSIEKAKEEMRAHIVSIQENPSKVESPVTTAVVFRDLAEGRPELRLLVQILQKLESMDFAFRYGELRTKGAYGNIHINTQVAPSPIVTVNLGGALNLYFGDVIWSGRTIDLYLSTNGYAALNYTTDKKYGPTFSVADLRASVSKNMVSGDLKYTIGYNWINGMVPTTLEVPGGKYYIKAFDGSTSAVAVTDNYFRIIASFEVDPKYGRSQTPLRLKGFALPANDFANLSYNDGARWVVIKDLHQADLKGAFVYTMLAPDLKEALPAKEQPEGYTTITFRMIVRSTGQTVSDTFRLVS